MRLRRSGNSGVPLLEILLLIGVLGGLVWFASNAMRKARQRAVLVILKPLGISGEFDDSGWLSGLDARGMPDDRFSLSGFRGLHDIPVLNLDHTEATDESLKDLPASLALTDLSLAGTAVGDAGCQEIARHSNLKRLDVRLTFVSDDGLQALSTLQQLQVLRLAQTWVTDDGLAALKALPKLVVLDLRDTAVTDDGLSTLAGLPDLKQVLLKNSDVTDRGVARLRSKRPDLEIEFAAKIDESVTMRLRKLQFSPGYSDLSPDFSGPDSFHTAAEGEQLRNFEITASQLYNGAGNAISSGVCLSDGWASEVIPDGRTKFSDSHLEMLSRFRQLKRLNMGSSCGSVSDVGVAHLKRNRMLRQLSLIGSGVTDEGLKSVARLPRLTHLWLDRLPITEPGLRTLCQSRNLQWLGLSKTSLTATAILQLKPLGLRSLEIRDAGIGEVELAAIGELETLEHLDLSQNAFLGSGLRHLSSLKSLRHLNLARTAVTDNDAQEILELSPRLRDVILTRSRVSPAAITKLLDSGREWEITMVIPDVYQDSQ